MRLLHYRDNGDISLTEHTGEFPPYAILSHTRGEDHGKVTFKECLHKEMAKTRKGIVSLYSADNKQLATDLGTSG
jgi:hypothetical protein